MRQRGYPTVCAAQTSLLAFDLDHSPARNSGVSERFQWNRSRVTALYAPMVSAWKPFEKDRRLKTASKTLSSHFEQLRELFIWRLVHELFLVAECRRLSFEVLMSKTTNLLSFEQRSLRNSKRKGAMACIQRQFDKRAPDNRGLKRIPPANGSLLESALKLRNQTNL